MTLNDVCGGSHNGLKGLNGLPLPGLNHEFIVKLKCGLWNFKNKV